MPGIPRKFVEPVLKHYISEGVIKKSGAGRGTVYSVNKKHEVFVTFKTDQVLPAALRPKMVSGAKELEREKTVKVVSKKRDVFDMVLVSLL